MGVRQASTGGQYQNAAPHCQLLPVSKVDRVLSWLFPFHCVLCGAGAAGMDLCTPCCRDLPWLRDVCDLCAMPVQGGGHCAVCAAQPPCIRSCRVAMAYEYPVDRLIAGLKFRKQAYLSRLLGELLALDLLCRPPVLPPPTLLLPVPLHRERQKQRGYNQAALIAATVGTALHLHCEPEGLQRIRATSAQTGLNRQGRLRNLHRAFAVGLDVAGAHVALVDDVITTGATTLACAEALLAAGASTVDVWAVARALRTSDTPAGSHEAD